MCPNVHDAKRQFSVFSHSLRHSGSESSCKASSPLIQIGGSVSTDGLFVYLGQLECPPARGATAEAQMEVVPHYYWATQGHSIADAFTESIDISVHCIATNGDDIAVRVGVIYLEIRFKKPEFLNAPLVVQYNSCTLLAINSRYSRWAGRTWRPLLSIPEIWRIKQFCCKFVDNFPELVLSERQRHRDRRNNR